MRLLLVAALVAAAFAARDSNKWNSEVRAESLEKVDSFKTGFEYRFNLEAQVSNGLPVPGSSQSAVRSQSLVSLTFPSETVAHLRLDKIRVASLQKEIDEPKKIQPYERFEEIELNEEHLRMLRLPVRFRYENGLVSEIEFDREDLPWSMNIKRIYLNMLQVNLAQKNSIEGRFRESSEISESSDNKNVFAAPERTLEGDCEVVYTIVPESESRRESREESELRVTKSINFEKCSVRVGQRYNFRFGDECPSCENKFVGEERNIESSSVFNYRIRGTPSRFLIKEVDLQSVYSYSPLSEQETFFTTFVSGELRLIEITKENNKIAAPKSEKKESLLHSMEWEKNEEKFAATGDESLLASSPYPEMKNKHEIVSRLIKSILSKMISEENGIEVAATHEMARIVRVLRLATKEDIKKMHKEICESDSKKDSEQMKDIFTDALALAGTFNTVNHLVEKIRAREVSPIKTSILLKHLTNIRVPSEKIVDSLVSLCKDSKRQPLERQSCWLTVGALMNGVCGEHRDLMAYESAEERKCPRPTKERFVRELEQQFEKAENSYEKILALKTIANSGMDLIVFPLEKIIKDEREPRAIRVQAIEALRKLRSVLPRKIVSVLMPLYKNMREQPEIRVAAFNQIMHTIPEKSIIDQITFQLDSEPSTQVHSFVFEALNQMARSEIPCEKPMADAIKTSLRMARVQPRKVLSSTYKHWTLFNEENASGVTLNWGALFSNDSVLPKEVMTTLETTFAGQWNKYLAQIGFSQHNIDQVLYKLVQKVEQQGLEEVMVRGKRSATFKPTEILRDLFSKVSIVSRKQSEQDPHALFYIRFRDMDYALLPIDEQVIPEVIKTIIKNGRIELGEMESILAKGLRFNTVLSSFVYERTRSIVHSMGSPLVYSSKMPTIFKVEGLIQAEIEPKNGKTFEGLRLRIQTRPTLASTHITKVEMQNPLVSLGVKLLHSATLNVPVDMTTQMSWENKFEVKTTMALPKESRRLVQLQTRPVSFIRVWPKETRTYVEPKEKTIYVEELERSVRAISSSHLEKATGVKVNVEGHVHSHIWEGDNERRIPSALLIGENSIEITFEKTPETPKEVVLRTEMENFKEESRMERPSMESFFEKDNEEHFKTEDYSEYSEDEEERRGAFDKYVKSYKSGKGYSHRVAASIKTVGGRKERKAELELTSVCDERMRHCKLALNGKRTPVVESEKRDWTMESSVEMLYPEQPETLKELLAQKHRELTLTLNSRWGSEEKNELKMKIQGEQNKEQKRWMKLVSELKKEESMTALEEYARLVEASMLNQYKIVAKYDLQCPVARNVVERLYSLLKAQTPFFKTSVQSGHNEERIVRAQLTIEPETRQYANLTLETPSEKVVIRELRLPAPLRLVNIRRQSRTPIRSLANVGSSIVEEVRAECSVESRKIRSFDDVIYRTPLTTCYSVLAKDCSSANEAEFAVLMKKISKKGEEKKMKIVSKEAVIELEMDKKADKVRVTINGEKEERVERLEKARIYKKNEVVLVELEDVTVEFDGFTANIKMSDYYKNKQCGICGHFDGEKKTEFRRADNEETEDLEEFHRSFLVKGEECEIEEEKLSEKRHYRIESEESSSSEEESGFESKWDENKSKRNNNEKKYEKENEVAEPIEKTRVIEYSNRVCFSLSPVPECPRKSMENEEELKEIKVKFTCLSRSDRETPRLMREARREVLKINDYPETFTDSIFVPRTCVVY